MCFPFYKKACKNSKETFSDKDKCNCQDELKILASELHELKTMYLYHAMNTKKHN